MENGGALSQAAVVIPNDKVNVRSLLSRMGLSPQDIQELESSFMDEDDKDALEGAQEDDTTTNALPAVPTRTRAQLQNDLHLALDRALRRMHTNDR